MAIRNIVKEGDPILNKVCRPVTNFDDRLATLLDLSLIHIYEMRPILPEMDKIPYFSVECWGGATFDSCIRFLDEDPARFQDLLLGRCHRIRVTTSST